MKNERRFTIMASADPKNFYTLDELDRMADEMLATAAWERSLPKTISDLNHGDIWNAWNAPKGANRGGAR